MIVELAASGKEALRLLAEGKPFDAVVIDHQLHEMDGLTLAEEIRKHPFGQQLPLVLLSSVRLRSDDTRPLRANISVFVHKPIRPAQLLDALSRAMNIQLQRPTKPPFSPPLTPNLPS